MTLLPAVSYPQAYIHVRKLSTGHATACSATSRGARVRSASLVNCSSSVGVAHSEQSARSRRSLRRRLTHGIRILHPQHLLTRAQCSCRQPLVAFQIQEPRLSGNSSRPRMESRSGSSRSSIPALPGRRRGEGWWLPLVMRPSYARCTATEAADPVTVIPAMLKPLTHLMRRLMAMVIQSTACFVLRGKS